MEEKNSTAFQKVATIVLSLSLLLSTGACLMNLARWFFKIDITPMTLYSLLITGSTTIIIYILLEIVENWGIIMKKLNFKKTYVDKLSKNLDGTMLKLKKEQASLYEKRVKAKNRLSELEAQILDVERILEKNKGV